MLVKSLEGIITLTELGDIIPLFRVSIYTYEVSKTLTLSTAHTAIIGCVHPNHVISIEGLDQDEVNNILVGKKVENTYVLKTAVLPFQKCPVQTFPNAILCGIPKLDNEVNDFNDTIVKVCAEFCENTREDIFLNSDVDSVSVDANFSV